MSKNSFSRLVKSDGARTVQASLLSMLIGLGAGSIIILIVGICSPELGLKSAWEGIRLVFAGLFLSLIHI